MANISFNEFMGKLSGKVEGFKTTVQEGKLMSASLQEVIDKTIRENSERIKRCVEEENSLDETKEIDIDPGCDIHSESKIMAINKKGLDLQASKIAGKVFSEGTYKGLGDFILVNEPPSKSAYIPPISADCSDKQPKITDWSQRYTDFWGDEMVFPSKYEKPLCAKEPDNCRIDIHLDAEYFNGIKISHQDIANAGVKVDDLDNYHMLVRDLVEEKPNRCHTQDKSETPWYSRMAPMEATFGVKLFNNGDKQ